MSRLGLSGRRYADFLWKYCGFTETGGEHLADFAGLQPLQKRRYPFSHVFFEANELLCNPYRGLEETVGFCLSEGEKQID